MNAFIKVLVLYIIIFSNSYAISLQKDWSIKNSYATSKYSIAKFDKDGNFYTAKNRDGFIKKFSLDGVLIWSSVIDQALIISEIVIDSNGSVYVGCERNTSIIKYSSSGTNLWTKFYTDHDKNDVHITVDKIGNIYVASSFSPKIGNFTPTVYDNFFTPYDISIIKINANGIKQWERIFSSTRNNYKYIMDFPLSIKSDSDNNIYVFGHAGGSLSDEILLEDNYKNKGTSLNFFLLKLLSDGTQEWIIRSNRLKNMLFLDNSNSIYSVRDSRQFSKINLDGSIDINNSVNDIQMEDFIIDLQFDEAGNKYFLGSSYLQKVNSDGTLAWTQLIDSNGSAYALKVESNESFYILSKDSLSKYTLISSAIDKEKNNTSIATLEYLANTKGTTTWQLISAPIATNIDVNELNAKMIYGLTNNKVINYYYQPVQLKVVNGYWLMPNKIETITLNYTPSVSKKDMIKSINNIMEFSFNSNSWLLFGVSYNTTLEELSKELKIHKIESLYQYNSHTGNFEITKTIKSGRGFWVKMFPIRTYNEGGAIIK